MSLEENGMNYDLGFVVRVILSHPDSEFCGETRLPFGTLSWVETVI